MKRRFPGGHASAGPPGPTFPGNLRPHDPRGLSRGGVRSGQRRPPTGSTNIGFHGRGGAGSIVGGGRHGRHGGRGAHYGNFPARGPPGRGQPGRGMNSLPIRGRGDVMGRGNAITTGGWNPGGPPMIGRGPPRPGPPNPKSHIPPPPPRGPMGPLQFQCAPPPPPKIPPPPQGIPPRSIHRGPMHVRQPHNNAVPPHFQHHPFQHGTPPSHIPGVASHASRTFPSHPPSVGHTLRPPQVGPFTYNSAPYSKIPNPAPSMAVASPINQSALRQVATQPGQGGARKPTADQIDQAWKEYISPKGVTYYHNPILGESTFTKPITLTKKATGLSSNTQEKRAWQEYEDAATGNKYYSDGVTTTWEKPAGFTAGAENGAQSEDPEPARKKKKVSSNRISPFSNKEEAIAAFKGLLLAKGVVPTIKWNEVVKIVSSDFRWEACKDALSVGERRQALAEYQTKRANELRDLERQERIRAKDAFGHLLTDILPTISGFSVSVSRFADVRSTLAKDDRFHAVATENTRESLFLDFCEELRKSDERKKRSKKKEAQDAFLSFLREREEAGKLSFASTWDSFFSALDEDEKNDERFLLSAAATDSDRQLYFADFVIALQTTEDDKRRRIRDARRRAEKAQRDAYIEVLQKLATTRKISPSTRWRSIEEIVFMDESFNLVAAQDRDSPRFLFEEYVNEWDDVYQRERSFLSRLLYPPNKKDFQIKAGISYEEFKKILLDQASGSQEFYGDTRHIIGTEEPVSSALLYYDELMARSSDISRHGSAQRRSSEESSEDEGEIIEESGVRVSNDETNQNADRVEPDEGALEGSVTLKNEGLMKEPVSAFNGSATELQPASSK